MFYPLSGARFIEIRPPSVKRLFARYVPTAVNMFLTLCMYTEKLMAEPHHTLPPALASFVSTFGSDPSRVIEEIRAHWSRTGSFGTPTQLYNSLIDARVATADIAPERAKFLKDYFAASFRPEQTTGYAAKHREPLTRALADLYTQSNPERPLFRIEADVSNLGGLNQAIPNRQVADQLFGTTTTMLRARLEALGDVTAIRKGGDEMALILSPRSGINTEAVHSQIRTIQTEMADFVREAGIDRIAHPKYQDRTGFGMGIAVVDMRHGTPQQQESVIQSGIERSKAEYDQLLHRSRSASTPALPLNGQPERALATSTYNSRVQSHGTYYDYVYGSAIPGDTPDTARLRFIERHLGSSADGPINTSEARALNGTHASTRALDPVTQLPVFGNMQGEQLPSFLRQHGSSGVRLAHVDINNMAAGNTLGSWVGDAMGRSYADVMGRALQSSDLGHLTPYMAAIPGGKFALLVPASLSSEQWQRFEQNLGRELRTASGTPLPLTPDQQQATRAIIAQSPELQRRYGQQGDVFMREGVRMDDLPNPKTGLTGSHATVAISSESIHPRQPLGNSLQPLEAHTAEQHLQLSAQRLSSIHAARARSIQTAGGAAGVGLGALNLVQSASDIVQGTITTETIARTAVGSVDTAMGATALTGQIATATGRVAGPLAKAAARASIPTAIAGGAVIAATQLAEGRTCEAVATTASTAGGLAGAWAGAKIGGAAGGAGGALIGGVGAVPGAAAGAVLGGIAGAIGVGILADRAATAACTPTATPTPHTRAAMAPLDEHSTMYGFIPPAPIEIATRSATAGLSTPVTPTPENASQHMAHASKSANTARFTR